MYWILPLLVTNIKTAANILNVTMSFMNTFCHVCCRKVELPASGFVICLPRFRHSLCQSVSHTSISIKNKEHSSHRFNTAEYHWHETDRRRQTPHIGKNEDSTLDLRLGALHWAHIARVDLTEWRARERIFLFRARQLHLTAGHGLKIIASNDNCYKASKTTSVIFFSFHICN